MNRVSIGSDNGLSPIRRQAIIYTNAGLLAIGPLGTKFSEILIKMQNLSLTKMHLKIPSANCWPFAQEETRINGIALCGGSGSDDEDNVFHLTCWWSRIQCIHVKNIIMSYFYPWYDYQFTNFITHHYHGSARKLKLSRRDLNWSITCFEANQSLVKLHTTHSRASHMRILLCGRRNVFTIFTM